MTIIGWNSPFFYILPPNTHTHKPKLKVKGIISTKTDKHKINWMHFQCTAELEFELMENVIDVCDCNLCLTQRVFCSLHFVLLWQKRSLVFLSLIDLWWRYAFLTALIIIFIFISFHVDIAVDATGKQQARNSRRRDYSSNFSQVQSKSDRSFSSQHKQQSQQQQQQHQQQYQLFAPKSRGGGVGGSSGGDARRHGGRGGCSGTGGGGSSNCDGGNSSSGSNNANGYPRIASSSGARLNPDDDENAELFASGFEFELNSVYFSGSKKQNLNHLLNFNYAPRDRNDSMTFMRSGNISKGGHAYVKRIKYNKEQFLQAK